MSLISWYIRYDFKKGDRRRDAGLSTPPEIQRYDDIVYGDSKKWQILDVYRPKDKAGKLPVILSVHGGGWVYGTKETYQFYCMDLAKRGFAVVNFTYRLAPEHRYPAQIEDTNAVVEWILKHSEEYGFDSDNIFAVGDSAGGHLLSVYTAMCNDSSYAAHYGIEIPKDFQFNATALNCGVYYQKMPKEKKGMDKLLDDLLRKGWTKEDLDWLNSYDKIREGFPPTFVMSSNGDILTSLVDIIVPELEKHKIEHTVKIYGNEQNVLGHVFHCNIKTKDAAICNDDECAFFRAHRKEAE